MTPEAWTGLAIGVIWFIAAYRNRIRDRAAAEVERRRDQLHTIRVRYGRPKLGRRRA